MVAYLMAQHGRNIVDFDIWIEDPLFFVVDVLTLDLFL